MKILDGYKTYIAAAGLILTGIAMCVDGNYEEGAKTILAGLALLGVGRKLEKLLG